MRDYCKSNQPNSLKPDVMIGPTSRKNSIVGDLVLDRDSGSLLTIAE